MQQLRASTPEPDDAAATPPDEPAVPQRIRTFKAPPLVLSRHLEAGAAFQAIIGAGLAHFLGNTPAVRGGEAEGVHQARVALRRLRAALALFAPLLRAPSTDPVAAELKRLGRVFGAARDWDVFRRDTLPQVAAECLEPGWAAALAEAAERKRRVAHAAVTDALDGAGLADLVAVLGVWGAGDHGQPLVNNRSGRLIAELAPDLLHRLARKAARRGKAIERRAGPELHALRKSLKKLRYGAEDFGALYKHKRTKPYLRACRHLLDVLGGINDGEVAIRLAEAAREPGEIVGPAVEALRRRSEARRATALGQFDAAWDAFAAAKPFWT